MVVVDSSALIPLARVGRLELVQTAFDTVRATTSVQDEVLVEGKPGTAALAAFLEDATLHEPPDRADEVAQLEGISATDASVILLARDRDERLLANDRGLIDVAETQGVEGWWLTTLLLHCTKEGLLSADDATDVLYELVEEGTNLDPQLYAKVQRKLQELGE